MTEADRFVSPLTGLAGACACGAVVFPASLHAIQRWVFLPARISSASHPGVRLAAGLAAVGASGVLAGGALGGVLQWTRSINDEAAVRLRTARMALLCAGGSVLVYSAFGGRVWRHPFPSASLLHAGTFARESVAVKPTELSSVLGKIAAVGKRRGCHSCGRRFLRTTVVADRQPARVDQPPPKVEEKTKEPSEDDKKVADEPPEQVENYYPQCQRCSTKQSTIVSDHQPNHPVPHHPLASLQPHYMWLPIPIIALLLLSTDNDDTPQTRGSNVTEQFETRQATLAPVTDLVSSANQTTDLKDAEESVVRDPVQQKVVVCMPTEEAVENSDDAEPHRNAHFLLQAFIAGAALLSLFK